MKLFEVTFYYHTNCTVKVEAENDQEALDLAHRRVAYLRVCDDVYTEQIMEGLQEDDDPDVVEVE